MCVCVCVCVSEGRGYSGGRVVGLGGGGGEEKWGTVITLDIGELCDTRHRCCYFSG